MQFKLCEEEEGGQIPLPSDLTNPRIDRIVWCDNTIAMVGVPELQLLFSDCIVRLPSPPLISELISVF